MSHPQAAPRRHSRPKRQRAREKSGLIVNGSSVRRSAGPEAATQEPPTIRSYDESKLHRCNDTIGSDDSASSS